MARNLQLNTGSGPYEETQVTVSEEMLNVLLISDRKECAAVLCESMESVGIAGSVHRIDADPTAPDRARSLCCDKSSRRPDFILFDLAAPTPELEALLAGLAFGRNRSRVPVVVLTSPQGESRLQSGTLDDGTAVMFSSISLPNLVATMRNKRRRRFLRALSVIYSVGPVLVRAPAGLIIQQEELALTA